MKKIFYIGITLTIISLLSCGEMNETVSPDASSVYEADIEAALQEIPAGELSDTLETFLKYIREEEKLARDVYLFSFDKWEYFVFDRIAGSEQRHMDAVKLLLDRYGVEDPVGENAAGIFENTDLQNLYQTLTVASSDSLTGALLVGAEIEEIDILDIMNALPSFDEEDVQLVLNHLLRGSYTHLKIYVKNLEANGIEYTPKHLAQEQFETILTYTDNHRGRGRNHGNGRRHGRGRHGGTQ